MQCLSVSLCRPVSAHIPYVVVRVVSNQWYIIRDILLPLLSCHFEVSGMSTYAHDPCEMWGEVSQNPCCILRESEKFCKEMDGKGKKDKYLRCRWDKKFSLYLDALPLCSFLHAGSVENHDTLAPQSFLLPILLVNQQCRLSTLLSCALKGGFLTICHREASR